MLQQSTAENVDRNGLAEAFRAPRLVESTDAPTRPGWSYVIKGIVAVAIVAGLAALVWQVADGGSTVDSFDVAEQNRLERLAHTPAGAPDASFQTAETTRLQQLAPTPATGDGSHQTAETTRFQQLAPTPATGDGSSEAAEASRHRRLTPATA
jgi:hypothetical protein